MEKNILCFGDSNTWGYNPENGNRYPRNERWTGIVAERLGEEYHIIEEGLNGRTTVWDDPVEGDKSGIRQLPIAITSHNPLDLLIIMLGTNDFKLRFSLSPRDIAWSLSRVVRAAKAMMVNTKIKPFEILLVCPAPVRDENSLGEIMTEVREKTLRLPPLVEEVARIYGVHYMNMGEYAEPSHIDGIHYDRESHKRAAAAMEAKIREILG